MKFVIPPPIILVCCLLLSYLLHQYLAVYSFESIYFRFVGLFFLAIGLSLDLSSLYYFIKHKTTINPINPEKTRRIVTSGSYRFSRNPMYLGLMFILLGFCFWLSEVSSFISVIVFYFCMTNYQIKKEEKILESLFGDEYLMYKNKVRRWL